MKSSIKIGISALLTAMLLVAVAFAGAAPTAPPDSVELATLGLNAIEPRNEGLPDFGPEVFEKPGKIMTPDGRYIMNEPDFDKAVIKNGNVKLPNTSSVSERVNATKNVMNQLWITLKVSDDEAIDTVCNYSANECTYRVSKLVKASASNALPASNGWTESASYRNSDGGSTTLFEGIWNVPSAPLDQAVPLQTIFYFTALENDAQTDIFQPVLEWGQYGSYWDISSWYGIDGSYSHSTPINVNVGDSIYGYIQQQQAGNQWLIYTLDITKNTATSITASSTRTYPKNYVALESYGVSTCSQFPGGNDFTNLNIAGRTPSWTSWINQSDQAFCGTLGVDIISPSEVILKTGRLP